MKTKKKAGKAKPVVTYINNSYALGFETKGSDNFLLFESVPGGVQVDKFDAPVIGRKQIEILIERLTKWLEVIP